MENSFQTSFIPKKPIIDNGMSSRKDRTTSISMVVSVFILIAVISATVGLFLYKSYLEKNKEQLSSNLVKVRDSFDSNTIAELEMYDKKSTTSKNILESHIVLSPLFELINSLTISSIQYTKFEHSTDSGVFIVKMSGVARDYKSIALQADVFNSEKGKMFKDLIFSNLTRDKGDYVSFNVEFTVDPALLSYSNNINKSAENNTNNIVIPQTETTIDNTTPTTDVSIKQPLQDNNGIQ